MITIAMMTMTMMMVNITKWTREQVMMNVSVFEDDPEVPSMMMITMTTMMQRNVVNKMLQGSIGRQRWRSNLATVSRSVLPTVFPPVEIYLFVHINISWHFVYT